MSARRMLMIPVSGSVDSTWPIESMMNPTSSILSFVDSPEFTFGMWMIVFLSRSKTSPIASV